MFVQPDLLKVRTLKNMVPYLGERAARPAVFSLVWRRAVFSLSTFPQIPFRASIKSAWIRHCGCSWQAASPLQDAGALSSTAKKIQCSPNSVRGGKREKWWISLDDDHWRPSREPGLSSGSLPAWMLRPSKPPGFHPCSFLREKSPLPSHLIADVASVTSQQDVSTHNGQFNSGLQQIHAAPKLQSLRK